MSEKFSNIAKLFWLYFCAPKTKSTSQARIKPEILVNFRPDPGPNPIRTQPEKHGPTYNSEPFFSEPPLFFRRTWTCKCRVRYHNLF